MIQWKVDLYNAEMRAIRLYAQHRTILLSAKMQKSNKQKKWNCYNGITTYNINSIVLESTDIILIKSLYRCIKISRESNSVRSKSHIQRCVLSIRVGLIKFHVGLSL